MLIVILLLGLVVAWCSQLLDATHGVAVVQVQLANETIEGANRSEALRSARDAIESSERISRITLYASSGIVLVAGIVYAAAGKPAARPV